jgi:hypothetical protein
MGPSKKKNEAIFMPKKSYWHLYSLQGLQCEKLVRIVNKILKREFMVIK